MPLALADIFSPQGALARTIAGYRLRPQQLALAERVAAALAGNQVLVAEAGTGTGKTYAYLVPALLSGGKIIISTGTKTLQDQLFNRDLPSVRQALQVPADLALLKGRANYLCHYHLERALADGRFLSREDAGHARAIALFAKTTQSGDKSECSAVPENSPVWSMVTSTRDNCLGQECPHYKECFVLAARRRAMEADVVVVNHHLFFADLALKDDGVAELLPAANAVIFDEAHQLPETASLFFGDSVSTAQVVDLARDTKIEALAAARDCLDLPPASASLEKAAKDLRLAFAVDGRRYALPQIAARREFAPLLNALIAELGSFAALLKTQAERSEGLEKCWQRSLELEEAFKRWQRAANGAATNNTNPPADAEDDAGSVLWGETTAYALHLNATPLLIGKHFQKQMEGHPRAWIFTSATLAVQNDFSHYCSEMGLGEVESARWESPFNYPEQAILYAPPGMPEPASENFCDAIASAALPILKASGGRAFFLCTSLRAMRRMHELISRQLEEEDLPFPLLMQGEGGKNELLERFRRLGNAILIGSQSFWEGVDVRGNALSLVVIDKLPFAPPDDPVLAARIERLNRQGRNAFMEYQLPRAVISVKQGAGRLIRDESDRGVLMICDPRLISRHYGKRIWRSLPPMKRSRELAEVLAFFNQT